MSTKYDICTYKKITIYGDVFEEGKVYIRGEKLNDISMVSQNNITTIEMSIDSTTFKNICYDYINYLKANK